MASVISALAVAILCGVSVYYKAQIDVVAALVLYVVLIAVFLFASFYLHELGHFLFGKITKMGVKINKVSPVASFASCSVNPQTEGKLKIRFLITVLGGIFINLLFTVIGVIFLHFPQTVWISALIPASFYVLLINLFPCEYSTGKTDGLVACEILNGADTAKVMLNILTVQAQINSGKLLKDIDESLLINVPQLREDDVNFIILTQLRAEYYAATGDMEQSEKYAKRYEEIKMYLP